MKDDNGKRIKRGILCIVIGILMGGASVWLSVGTAGYSSSHYLRNMTGDEFLAGLFMIFGAYGIACGVSFLTKKNKKDE